MNQVPPSVRKTAFNCPHCEALAHQSWYSLRASKILENKAPQILEVRDPEEYLSSLKTIHDREQTKKKIIKIMQGNIVLERKGDHQHSKGLYNLFISECFNCNDISVWIHERLVHPQKGNAPLANPDLPLDIRRDYDEASNILDSSPRGAAALLRLAIQKLCKELGQSGNDLNADIGDLVKKGLDLHIQRALDVVRVTGNEAVHPGQIDLTDDRDAAETLFGLVNVITEKMISVPKHIDDLYEALPKDKRKQIDRRDAPISQKDA